VPSPAALAAEKKKIVAFMRMVLGLAAPLAISAQVNLSGVWRWDRPANAANPNGPSQMWKNIEQDGSRITVRIRVVNAGGVESDVFVFIVGSAGNRNRMHGAPMTSSVRWEGSVLQVDSVARFGDEDLRMTDTYQLSGDGGRLTFRQRHQFGREPEGVDETVFLRQPASACPPMSRPGRPSKSTRTFRFSEVCLHPSCSQLWRLLRNRWA